MLLFACAEIPGTAYTRVRRKFLHSRPMSQDPVAAILYLNIDRNVMRCLNYLRPQGRALGQRCSESAETI